MTHQPLKPVSELVKANVVRFPNESAAYRAARDALLAEEIELRRHIERVAELRRALPPGGEVTKSYVFEGENGKANFADLFGGKQTLAIYSYMFGPQRERPCPMCTSFVGSLDIPAPDMEQRLAIAILGRSPVARQLAFARERGWHNLKFYQTVGDDFARDYRILQDGEEWAAVLVWKRDGDRVRLFWAAEGGPETADPGFDPHLAPDPTPLWTIIDWTPEGRPVGWYPKLNYGV
jgi:predicted dithiol-disulfide oxidoreductase (DUF899 family)